MKKKKETSSFNLKIEKFLEVNPEEIKLKFAFDHLRNYGIAAMVMFAGFYLFRNGASNIDFIPYSNIIFGIFLLIIGFLLFSLNLIQMIIVFAKHKSKMLPYLVTSVFSVLAASELLWALVKDKLK